MGAVRGQVHRADGEACAAQEGSISFQIVLLKPSPRGNYLRVPMVVCTVGVKTKVTVPTLAPTGFGGRRTRSSSRSGDALRALALPSSEVRLQHTLLPGPTVRPTPSRSFQEFHSHEYYAGPGGPGGALSNNSSSLQEQQGENWGGGGRWQG
ncbi:hypothetical protein NDU88_005161 [Pleurodeles waltl]|uniref:Uncharacterized protein n=1 Tax=Pleurodeles waltl TaxID=8319 RepID=A0AAV7VI98_PLEWA|nr:hypothetical protein NDU88_005161 [Pleurodeles waltl]